MYHYIFFDLDGTLTDSKEGILNSLRYAFDKLGEPVPPESTLIKFIGPPLQDSFAEFCGFSAERAAEAIAVFRERYEPVGKFENMAAPGMADLCARLKARGYVLALASSKPESLCVPICEKFGFTPSLAVVTGSPPVGDWSKADVIRETMRRLELTEAHKPEILMVGDRKFDVLGAKACGIACAGVEFFGYAAGAFTGAAKSGKPGMFELAHKGTLLLDEIGELPLPMQAKLLQVLDGHPFHRVGGTKPITVDVRVIAATNKPLADMAASGQFREDLFYRLRVLTVEIPPLRERPDDIPVLAMHFLQEIIKKSGLQKNFDPQVLNCFLTYRWPGNVRELRALVQSLATMSEEETITMQDLPQYMQAQSPLPQGSVSFRQPMREAVAELERNMIMTALTETGSTYKAARRLKVSQSTIVRKAQRYKIGLVEIAHK